MGRKRMAAELFIFMNGQKVGKLLQNAAGKLEMTYAEEWLASEARRPLSLSLPVSSRKHSGEVVENFFDNLLPDSQPIRNRIQARFGARTNRSFDLLWHIGRDCVGALQLSPDETPMDVRRVEAEPLTEAQIAETLRNYRTMPLGMGADNEFRISMAGAQEKTALLRLDGGWHRPLGATPTTHIVKLPIGRIEHSNMDLSDSVENEWLCHLLLKAYGLPVADAEIVTFDGVKALVVERFDRRWAEDRSWIIRLPQEDMCQALGVSAALQYERDGGPGIGRIMELLLGSSEGLSDRHTFMTLQVVFWLLGTIDVHAKNFSIYLLPGGRFRLAPAYNILSAYPLAPKRQAEPNTSGAAAARLAGKQNYWTEIVHRWLMTAQACRFPPDEMEAIVGDLLDRMDEVIQAVTEQLPPSFPADTAGPILDGMREARERLVRSRS